MGGGTSVGSGMSVRGGTFHGVVAYLGEEFDFGPY